MTILRKTPQIGGPELVRGSAIIHTQLPSLGSK